MSRTLVIGYGNLDRGDDGVAYYVVNALRQRLGQIPLTEYDTGLEELGATVDSIFLTQLMPELIDTLADYEQVIFIDAHVIQDMPDLHCTPIKPEYTPSAFTHHMTPAILLMLLKTLHHKEPKAHLVSLRGWEFDFHRGLSKKTSALVQPAIEHIMALLAF
ncbi:MAG: hydrogenase maturation protease [Anaerolineae bacterium]